MLGDLDHLEVRPPRRGPAHLESLQLRHLRAALPRTVHGRAAERAMGQRPVADARDLGDRHRRRVASRARPHHPHLPRRLHRLRAPPQSHHRPHLSRGGRAADRTDVPALRAVHGDRSQDHRDLAPLEHRRRHRGGRRRDGAAPGGGGVRTVLRAVHGGARRDRGRGAARPTGGRPRLTAAGRTRTRAGRACAPRLIREGFRAIFESQTLALS